MPKQTTMTDALRKALNDAIEAGETFRSIERETGIVRQSLMPFARGEQSLLPSKADKLTTYFGLELKPTTKGKGN
jgi:hypothetical protein